MEIQNSGACPLLIVGVTWDAGLLATDQLRCRQGSVSPDAESDLSPGFSIDLSNMVLSIAGQNGARETNQLTRKNLGCGSLMASCAFKDVLRAPICLCQNS